MADNKLELKVITSLQDKLSAPLKGIGGASLQAAKELEKLQTELKQLSSTQKNIEQFRNLKTSLDASKTAFETAQARVKALAQELSKTDAPSRKLQSQFQKAKNEASQLKDKLSSQSVELQKLRTNLSNAGISTKSLSQGEIGLRQNITRTNEALTQQHQKLAQVQTAQTKLAEAKDKFKAKQDIASKLALTGAASFATGNKILAPIGSAMGDFASLEESSTQLKISMMTAGGEVSTRFQEVTDLATKLGDRLPGTTADFQNMMTMLKRQGMTDDTILGGLGESAAHMGVLLNLQVEQAAEYAAKMQDALQAPESEMLKITDGMQRMYYAGVDASNILAGFSKAAPALKTLGKSGHDAFQELAPMLAMFDQSGMDGAAAGNALRKVLSRSIDNERLFDANEELKNQGIKFRLDFTDGKGEFGGVDHLFKELEKLQNLTSQQRNSVLKYLIGDDAETNQVITTLMSKGKMGYQEMANKLAAQASLDDRINAQLNTLKNTMEAAEGSWTNAMAEIGKTVAEPLKEIINFFGRVANSISEFVRQNPVLVGWLVRIVAGIGGVLVAFGGLAIVIAGIIGPLAMMSLSWKFLSISMTSGIGILGKLGTAFGFVKTAIFGIAKALLTNPLVLVLAAIAGAAYLIYRNWDYLKAKAIEIWTSIKQRFTEGWTYLTNLTNTIGSVLKAAFTAVWNSIVSFFTGIWTQLKTAASGGLAGIAALIVNWSPLGLFYQSFAGVLSWFGLDLPANLTGAVSTLISNISNKISTWNIASVFQTVWSGVTGLFTGYVAQFTEFGSNLISGLVNGIRNMAGAAKEAIANVGSGVIRWFKEKLDMHSPSRVFVGLGGFVSEGLAKGINASAAMAVKASKALATGTLAGAAALTTAAFTPPVVNAPVVEPANIKFDRRPGLTTLAQQQASTAPAAQTNTHNNQSVTEQITINIYGGAMDPQAIAKAVKQELERRESERRSAMRSRYTDYGA
ncbi:phage tail tape measure protein [Pelistega sp. MC2]|uniref:phage tail tape measure protein n=1 Tax=Pelistega sp. MC2 TaxID=1720297 RepID=UPI0008DAACD5|nr:phage tail tape measure protein [Pelistega sp. MC2]